MVKKYFYACACLLLIWSYALQAQMVWEQSTGTSTCFSSARATDLNGDGVKDMVIGGGIESIFDVEGNIVQTPSDYMVTAINGATGDWLWNVQGMDQIFGSPIFLDVTGDGTDDVFVGGRNGYFLCIDGASGEVNWQYYEGSNGQNASNVGLYNFYNAQWVPDQNFDGYKDLLVSNGGDRVLPPWETDRPAGKLMIIDPVDGALLGSADMPDGKETYMSPVVYDFFRDGKLDVIFGTGGETISGSLFRAPLSDVMRGDLSNATTIIETATKGFIAPPSLADLTGDNIPELITNTYEGHIIATDGWTNEVLWDYTVEGAETNASPAIGLFNGDNVPDVFTSFLIGVAPTYSGAVQLMIDGATGEKVYENDLGFLQYSSPVVYDLNSDGVHEAIGMINNVGDSFSHDIIAFDFANGTETSLLGDAVGGTNIASTPWIGNLDNDGELDMFYAHHADETVFISDESITFKRISLEGVTDTNHVAWGGYMGTDGDGFFDNEVDSCFQTLWVPTTYAVSPTCKGGDDGEAQINSNGCPCQFSTCVYQWSNGDSVKHTYNLAAGEHFVTLVHEDGCVMVHRVTIEDPDGPETVMEQSLCAGGNTGSISVLNINDTIPYLSYDWSTGETTPSISNLGGGMYTVTVLSPDSCLEVLEFEIIEPAVFEMGEPLATNISCNGETDGSLFLTPTGGTPPYTLNLDDGTETTEYTFENDITLENLPTGTYIYDIRETNGCGVLQGFVDIVEPEVFERAFTVQNINCAGDMGSFEVVLSGGTAPFQYVDWMGALSDPFDQTVFSFNDLEAGLYSMEFLDANGCSVSLNAIIEAGTPLESSSNVQAINCFGDLGAIQVNIEGGMLPYSYSFNGEAEVMGEETALLFSDLSPGTYAIDITDMNNCLVQLTEIVEAVEELTATVEVINADNEASMDGSVNFTISGGTAPFSYNFGNGNTGTSEDGNVNLTGYGTGDYSLVIFDANSCEFTTDVSIAAENVGTSVEDLIQSHISIYPNPNQGQFVIESAEFTQITIFDAVGKIVNFEKVVVENGTTVVSVVNASKGVYFIRLDGNDISVLEKVVIF